MSDVNGEGYACIGTEVVYTLSVSYPLFALNPRMI